MDYSFKRRVLILGATGMAGHVMYEYLQRPEFDYEVEGTARFDHPHFRKFDALWDVSKIDEFFRSISGSFDAVINCIGCLVADSQAHPDTALRINAALPRRLEQFFSGSPTKIVHLSTDCVFDGLKGCPYHVTDLPTEMGPYGFSKFLGEICNEKDWTIRTSIIGPELANKPSSDGNSGLLNWFLNQPEGSEILGYSQAHWSGISTIELADIVARNLFEGYSGLHQICRPFNISKYELLREANQVFCRNLTIQPSKLKRLDKSLIPTQNSPIIDDPYRSMFDEIFDWMAERKDLYDYNLDYTKVYSYAGR